MPASDTVDRCLLAATVTGKATVVVMQTGGRWDMSLTVTDTSTGEGAESPSCKLALGLTRAALKLQALVYDILPSTTAVFSYAIGSRKLSANEQFFLLVLKLL